MSRWTILRILYILPLPGTLGKKSTSVRESRFPWRAVTGNALGPGDAVALRVVDAELAHAPQHGIGLDPLGHGGNAHRAAHAADRRDHRPVDRVAGDVAHEFAVDLEEVDRQVLEVAERAHPRAEVVQREA